MLKINKPLPTLSSVIRTYSPPLNSVPLSVGFVDFTGGSAVKYLPAMKKTQDMWVQSLGWEDPLEEEMATHSGIFAWKIPWTEKPDGLQSLESDMIEHS